MKSFNCFIVTVMTVMSSTLFAGPVLKPMADVIVLPDDSVVLADPFIDATATQDGGGPLLQLLNPRIYQTIALYKRVSLTAAVTSSEIDRVYDSLLNKRTNLRFYGLSSAEEMNKYCYAGRPVYTIPSGASVLQAACTKGNDTFIVKPLFLKLSIRDQAMLLIHERLTTIADDRGWINFVAVAKYTTGLNTFLNVYNEQARREFRELTDKEHANLAGFYTSIMEIHHRNAEYGNMPTFGYNIQKNGGGLVSAEAIVDPTAFVSLNSVVGKKSELQSKSKVINLTFNGTNNPHYVLTLRLAENAVLENVDFKGGNYAGKTLGLGLNTKLINSTLSYVSNFTVGNDSFIKDSMFNGESFNGADNLSLTGAEINAKTAVFEKGVVFQASKFNYGYSNVTVAANEQLLNTMTAENTASQYYPAGVVPKPFQQTVAVPTFKCVLNTKSEKKGWEWKESSLNDKGDGVTISGWIGYNGRNGLKKEYEYNYTQTKIVINFKNFERTKTPVVFLNEQGRFVAGDYLKTNALIKIPYDNCTFAAINEALEKVGISYVDNIGYKIPLAF